MFDWGDEVIESAKKEYLSLVRGFIFPTLLVPFLQNQLNQALYTTITICILNQKTIQSVN